MRSDSFYTKTTCDRCHKPLGARTTSWFTQEPLCMACAEAEGLIKTSLRAKGKSDMEGCGFIPQKGKDY